MGSCKLLLHAAAVLPYFRACQEHFQPLRDALTAVSAAVDGPAHAQLARDAVGVVELVVRHRHDQLWHSATKGLSGGADPAVVDEGSTARQQRAEGGVVEVANIVGQVLRD